MSEPTDTDIETVIAIHRFRERTGRAPSIADIATELGLGSKSAAQKRMERAFAKNLITKPYTMGEWALRPEAERLLPKKRSRRA